MRQIALIASLLMVASAAHQVWALSESLPRPKLFLPKTYDTNRAAQVSAVLTADKFKYLDGMTSYWPPNWGTTLVYEGNAANLNDFITALNRIPDVAVRLTFSSDLARETGSSLSTGSWWVKYSHTEPDVITVRINLAAPQLGKERFELRLPK